VARDEAGAVLAALAMVILFLIDPAVVESMAV
jgi:hypothetical protein